MPKYGDVLSGTFDVAICMFRAIVCQAQCDGLCFVRKQLYLGSEVLAQHEVYECFVGRGTQIQRDVSETCLQ